MTTEVYSMPPAATAVAEPPATIPLSDSADAAEERLGPCRPLLQVDQFTWPVSVTELGQVAAVALDELAERLLAGAADGRKIVGLASCRRGDGCTTVLLLAARRLAERGVKVALVDADMLQPRLARRMGVQAEAGWQHVAARRLPLGETLIESVADGLTLLPSVALPLCEEERVPDYLDLGLLVAQFRHDFDVVLVDLGCPVEGEAGAVGPNGISGSWIDVAAVVCDVHATLEDERSALCQQLQTAGISDVGIVENFV